MVDSAYVDSMCEIPLAIAACPTAAIKPKKVEVDGQQKNSVEINNSRCMFCGNCYTMCPSLPLADKDQDTIFETALESGAEDVVFGDEFAEIYTAPSDLKAVSQAFQVAVAAHEERAGGSGGVRR